MKARGNATSTKKSSPRPGARSSNRPTSDRAPSKSRALGPDAKKTKATAKVPKKATPKRVAAKASAPKSAKASPPRDSDGPTATAKSPRTRTAPKKGSTRRARPPAETEALPKLVFREVGTKTWPDFEKLFEGSGAPKYCWCMAWRTTPRELEKAGIPSRKAAMKGLVTDKTPVGILGYAGGEPVAWCSIAPRETYRHTLVKARPADEGEKIWSVVCFFVHRSLRHRGVMKPMIEAAKAHAKKKGASVLEAYPVDVTSPSYRFGGFRPSFEAAGFVEVGKEGSRRHVVRYAL